MNILYYDPFGFGALKPQSLESKVVSGLFSALFVKVCFSPFVYSRCCVKYVGIVMLGYVLRVARLVIY
jgi:hypothetical protein